MSNENWFYIIVPTLTYPLICLFYFRILHKRHIELNRLMEKKTLQKYIKLFGVKDPFKQYYDWIGYLLPVTLNMLTVGILIYGFILKHSTFDTGSTLYMIFSKMTPAVWFGLAGAYFWTHYDMLRRFYVVDLNSVSLYNMWLRLLVSGTLAYLVGLTVQHPVNLLVAFGIGTFPLHTLSRFARYQAQERFKTLAESEESEKPNLFMIQGMTKNIIERFQEENIYSVEHLALYNPLKLLLRTNIEWTIILDLIDQAILINYVGDKINDLRQTGIRCAMEFSDIKDQPVKKINGMEISDNLVNSISQKLGWDKSCILNLMYTLQNDPQMQFISYLWDEAFPDEEKTFIEDKKMVFGNS